MQTEYWKVRTTANSITGADSNRFYNYHFQMVHPRGKSSNRIIEFLEAIQVWIAVVKLPSEVRTCARSS